MRKIRVTIVCVQYEWMHLALYYEMTFCDLVLLQADDGCAEVPAVGGPFDCPLLGHAFVGHRFSSLTAVVDKEAKSCVWISDETIRIASSFLNVSDFIMFVFPRVDPVCFMCQIHRRRSVQVRILNLNDESGDTQGDTPT